MVTDESSFTLDELCIFLAFKLWENRRLPFSFKDIRVRNRRNNWIREPNAHWCQIPAAFFDDDARNNKQRVVRLFGPREIVSPYPDFVIRATALAIPSQAIKASEAIDNLVRRKFIDQSDSIHEWNTRESPCWRMPDGRFVRVRIDSFDHDYSGVLVEAKVDGRLIIPGEQVTAELEVRDGDVYYHPRTLELNDRGRGQLSALSKELKWLAAKAWHEERGKPEECRQADESAIAEIGVSQVRRGKPEECRQADESQAVPPTPATSTEQGESKAQPIESSSSATARFRQKGTSWDIAFDGIEGIYPDLDGFFYIHELLLEWHRKEGEGNSIAAMDLYKRRHPPDHSNSSRARTSEELGHRDSAVQSGYSRPEPVIDSKTKKDVEEKMRLLVDEIKELVEGTSAAEANEQRGNAVLLQAKREEFQKLADYVKKSHGHQNKVRDLHTKEENCARMAIRSSLNVAYGKLESGNPPMMALIDHLKACIPPATGGYFIYLPPSHSTPQFDWLL